jgi:hypothetical protein
MAEEILKLDSPIDVMYLIHKALSAEAARVQREIEQLEIGGSQQPFRAAFNFWAAALMYHADTEDQYMTAPMTDFQQARDNEAEHAELAGLMDDLTAYMEKGDVKRLEERVSAAIIALHEQQHNELMEKLEDVLAVLNEEIGRTRLIARTRRHLYGKVVALRICQDDHLESEDAFVLPKIREWMSDTDQLQLVNRLLIDKDAEDTSWILDWVAKESTPGERKLLKGIVARFEGQSSAAD